MICVTYAEHTSKKSTKLPRVSINEKVGRSRLKKVLKAVLGSIQGGQTKSRHRDGANRWQLFSRELPVPERMRAAHRLEHT
jgi:hypothetical protein